MTLPITPTKIVVPSPRFDLLSRQRLLDLLYELLDHKLLIISAPAGYGKTSLLIDLAQHVELPVCWYTLDGFDQDAVRFIAHFIAAIAQRFPQFGRKSMEALQRAMASLGTDTLVSATVNEIHEVIREHFILILDDYQFVDRVPKINNFVNQFVQQMGENCHLIIASRSLLPLADLPLLVARSQVGGLSFNELAFQSPEIQALTLQNYHLLIPESEAEALVRETEGWITGLLLSAANMWQGMADRLRVARASGVGLYDYLAQQVLDHQPGEVQEFLLRTSLFDDFDAELCDAVLKPSLYAEDANFRKLIDIVLRSNLFVIRVGDSGRWVRYHHLFREFLQSQMVRERPAERELILRRLALVRSQHGEWEKAYDLYRQLYDEEGAARLIEQAESSLLANGRLALLAQWLDQLHGGTLIAYPHLVALHGYARVILGEVERGFLLLDRAASTLREAGDTYHLCRTLLWRAVAYRNLGKYNASLADADEALRLVGQGDELQTFRAEALHVKGIALFRIGQLDDAIAWLERSRNVYARLDDWENVAPVNMDLGMVYSQAGAYRQAENCYTEALEYWRREGNIVWQANLLNHLAVLYQLSGKYESSFSMLEEALARSRESGYVTLQAFILASIGDLYSDLEETKAALSAYSQARALALRANNRFLLLYLDLHEAGLALSSRGLNEARRLVDSAGQIAKETASAFEEAICQIEAGRLAFAEGKYKAAVANLHNGAERTSELGHRVEAARAHLLLASAYTKSGRAKESLASLNRAFDLAAEPDCQQHLVIAGRECRNALTAALSDPVVGRQASKLLEKIREFERSLPFLRRRLRRRDMSIPLSPAKLTIQALGAARVIVGDQVITSTDWQSQAARDLFFHLLAQSDGLTKEAIGATFWPDYSPGRLKLHFKNTLYRMRHAVGQEAVLFEQDRYSFNRRLDYEYDAETFSANLARAQAATDENTRAAAYAAAVRLYKGPLLPEVEGTWVLPERERLSRAYLGALVKLTELGLAGRDFKPALDYCQRALDEDPCLEEAHRLAMRIYAAMGNQAEVTRQFERCQETLRSEIDASPSEETESLYAQLSR